MTKEEIEAKLKEENIDPKLGNGLSFAKPEDLDSWISDFKTTEQSRIEALKTKLESKKGIEEYTADDLRELLKDPKTKAKGLQSLADGLRAEINSKKKKDDKSEEDSSVIAELKNQLKTLTDTITEMKSSSDKKSKENTFGSIFDKYAEGLEDADKTYVKATLTLDSSEEEIKKAVGDYKSLMAKRGFKNFGVDNSHKTKSGETEDKDLSDSVKRILKEKEEKQKTD